MLSAYLVFLKKK